MFLIRNSSLLLIKSQTKSTLLKNKIHASPNDRFGLNGLLTVFKIIRIVVLISQLKKSRPRMFLCENSPLAWGMYPHIRGYCSPRCGENMRPMACLVPISCKP